MSGKDRQLQTMMSHSPSSKLRRPVFLALILAAAVPLAACVYRPTIQQGNLLKPSDVDQVTPGMTRTQVRYLLGTPMINDPFDPQRWDYVYRLTTGRKRDTIEAHFVVFFEGDEVSRIERRSVPESLTQPQKNKKKQDAAAETLDPDREPPPAPSVEPARPDAPRPGN
jgi:outer membrane protein assembly factor BamE